MRRSPATAMPAFLVSVCASSDQRADEGRLERNVNRVANAAEQARRLVDGVHQDLCRVLAGDDHPLPRRIDGEEAGKGQQLALKAAVRQLPSRWIDAEH